MVDGNCDFIEKRPFFSIIIPTKNRNFLVGYAIQSVLMQSFQDFEIILVDNDDTNLTNIVVRGFHDPRIRYFRTGTLSMADNWEYGIDQVKGDYVLLLEDKMVLKTHALQKIKKIIDNFPDYPICWRYDVYNEDLDRLTTPKDLTGEETIVSSEIIIKSFFDCDFGFFNNNSPRGLNSCIPRKIVSQIKNGKCNRFFVPLSPDFTSAFQTLLTVDRVISLNDSLVIVGGLKYSGGNDAYLRGPIARKFLKDNNINSDDELFDKVPLKIYSVRNGLFNDIFNLLINLENNIYESLNTEEYLLFIYDELMMVQSMGKDISLEIEGWNQYLEVINPDTRERISVKKRELEMRYVINSSNKSINSVIMIFLQRFCKKLTSSLHLVKRRNILFYANA